MNLLFLLLPFLFSVPEPGVLLYGYIRDDSCSLNEATKMQWSLTPVNGEETYTYEAKVGTATQQAGLLFYRVHLPLATIIPGCEPPADAILVDKTVKEYTLTLSIEGTNLQRTETVQLSALDRGTFRRWSFTW